MSEMTSGLVERGSFDADGIMIRAAAVLGKYHGEQGYPSSPPHNTDARISAYFAAYRAARAPLPAPPGKDTIV